jgi:hypothetical protein
MPPRRNKAQCHAYFSAGDANICGASVATFGFVFSNPDSRVLEGREWITPDGTALIAEKWSGRQDSNLRPPGPKPGALPG